jgi:hypothetical protein
MVSPLHSSHRLRLAALVVAPTLSAAALIASPAAGLAVARHVPHRAVVSQTFSASSWWNTPLGAAPVDSHSAAYIADSVNPAHSQNYLNLVLGSWGSPAYTATASDPLYTIDSSSYGPTVTVHIPAGATQQPTSDSEINVIDASTNQAVGLWHANYNASTHKWSSGGTDRYYLNSGGIQQKLLGGTAGNDGHRGVPSPFRGVHMSDVTGGAIDHRLEVYWHATAGSTPTGAKSYFPMSGSEQNKGGIVPEGIVVRIKASVDLKSKNLSPAALIVATALQSYGAVVGDNSGSGDNLKLQSNANWTGMLTKDSLKSIPWTDYEFVQGGYRP